MIQDIYPSKLNNAYVKYKIDREDALLVFNGDGKILVREEEGAIIFPNNEVIDDENAVYLFSVDGKKYFLSLPKPQVEETAQPEGFVYYSIREIRDLFEGKEVFAAFTAYHLWKWYADNRYCGKCRTQFILGENERSLVCPTCRNTVYPRINPAVIVGVIKEDCLLVTKYKSGYANNALIAGFTEIGETLEETVSREVFEETGVKVKNIRYYKSQPWGMAQDILVGFYCEADGEGEIHMDENELKYAEWVKREDIELQPNNLSLTNEMMKNFKEKLFC